MTPHEQYPDTIHGYEKDLDWDRELSYAKTHEDDGRRTQVHAEIMPGGWWVHATETDLDGNDEIASVDLGTHTRESAISRLMDFMEHNQLGLSPSTDLMLKHHHEQQIECLEANQ